MNLGKKHVCPLRLVQDQGEGIDLLRIKYLMLPLQLRGLPGDRSRHTTGTQPHGRTLGDGDTQQ